MGGIRHKGSANHILPIDFPPLRERKDALPLLVDYFLQLYDKNHPPLPGHIRELQNVLHRYLTLKRLDFTGMPTIRTTRLEGSPSKDGDSVRKGFAANTSPGGQVQPAQGDHDIQVEEPMMNLKTLERNNILRALSEHNWHRGRTASALDINRKTLFLKMQKFGLSRH